MTSLNIVYKEQSIAEIHARKAHLDEWFDPIRPIVAHALGDAWWTRSTDEALRGGTASVSIHLHNSQPEDEYTLLKRLADALDTSGVPYMWAAEAWETGDGKGGIKVEPYLAIKIPAFEMPPIPAEWWYTEPAEAIAV